jgi:hypothetical protein
VVGTVSRPFSDFEQAKAALARRSARHQPHPLPTPSLREGGGAPSPDGSDAAQNRAGRFAC